MSTSVPEIEKALPPAAAIQPGSRPSVLAPGALLQDRYRIVRQLGKGGMGAVYEAVDQRLDTTVALKETFSVDDRLRRQFEQEARLLAQLHHPSLPKVTDYFTEGDRAFLVMQFISGVDLAVIIARQPGPLPRNQVVAWADQLLDALIYLHTRERQIIHRDIKPHNLKLISTGKIALLDFGLAKTQSADMSVTNSSSSSIFGYTRRYAPLEQIQDQGTTPQSDIYALGATLYHLLTGVKPPDALARAAALVNSKTDPLRPADEVHRAVGPELAAILCRAMAQNPEDRYPSARAFREALWRVGRSETRITKNSTRASVPASVASGDTTVARKSFDEVSDPFDRYSILKPDQTAWLIPKHGRGPAVVAAVVIMLLALGVGMFYGYDHLVEPSAAAVDFARTTSDQRVSGSNAASMHSASVSDASRKDSKRQSDKPERRTLRTDSANSSAPTVAPSSSPSLRLRRVSGNSQPASQAR